MKKYIFLLSIFFSITCISCSKDDEYSFYRDVSFSGKISNSDQFCAFTDLVKFKNIFYCCFREGNAHMPSSPENYGKIKILKSYDGKIWTDAVLISDNNYDLRDPKLELTSDGKLMLLVGALKIENGILKFKKTRVSFSSGELSELSELQDLKLGDHGQYSSRWLWRSVWYEGKAYGIAYLSGCKPILLSSTDGINYTELIEFDLPITCNEAGITFRNNGNMVVVIRDNNSNGFIAESKVPYTNWNWSAVGVNSHSPTLINVENNIILAIRNVSTWKDVSLISLDKNLNFKYLYNIPTSGDMGYPGIAIDDKSLLVSYYSDRSVYIAKFPIQKFLNN